MDPLPISWHELGQPPVASWPLKGQLPVSWPDMDEPPTRPLTDPWAITPNWPVKKNQIQNARCLYNICP
jgi:hypothetical protein